MMIGLNERARFFRMRAEAEAPQEPTRRAESHSQSPLPLCKRNIMEYPNSETRRSSRERFLNMNVFDYFG